MKHKMLGCPRHTQCVQNNSWAIIHTHEDYTLQECDSYDRSWSCYWRILADKNLCFTCYRPHFLFVIPTVWRWQPRKPCILIQVLEVSVVLEQWQQLFTMWHCSPLRGGRAAFWGIPIWRNLCCLVIRVINLNPNLTESRPLYTPLAPFHTHSNQAGLLGQHAALRSHVLIPSWAPLGSHRFWNDPLLHLITHFSPQPFYFAVACLSASPGFSSVLICLSLSPPLKPRPL